PADWDRMTVATICGATEKVRASAARLGIEAPEAPERSSEAEQCRIEAPIAGGMTILDARRTGPVTARITSMDRAVDGASSFGDEWAIEGQRRTRVPDDLEPARAQEFGERGVPRALLHE